MRAQNYIDCIGLRSVGLRDKILKFSSEGIFEGECLTFETEHRVSADVRNQER